MAGYMKDNRSLELLECVKVSHDDARTRSFRVKVKASDYEKAMSDQTWPYRVKVRQYMHFKQDGADGGQFGVNGQ